MKKIIIIAVWLLTLPVLAQKKDAGYTTKLSTLVQGSTAFLESNKLSSAQMKKMMEDTFHSKSEQSDFTKAVDKYFAKQYDKDLVEILQPYYSKQLNVAQIDTLINGVKSEGIKRATDGLAQCEDAAYRDKKVDETLATTVTAKNDKAKAKAIAKIKKNMKKFSSDCPADYRQAITTYTQTVGQEMPAEDHVNAIYHTVSLDDLSAYTAFVGSNAAHMEHAVETAVADDIYNVRAACISKFQSWTYKAYPSLFTKKQVQPKKGRKGRKGKAAKKAQQDDDRILEGVEI